ncbi:MAG: glycosyltransferase family 39 protein [Lentimicrobiaceae bacterium]
MVNIYIGIAVFMVCVLLSFAGYRLLVKEKYPSALVMILIIALALRLFVATDGYLHTWDERFHALVAKNLVSHPLRPTLYDNPVLPYDVDNWIANHVWLDKGPVPLWGMALSIYFVGNTDFAVRIPALILSLLSVYLTFLIGRLLFDHRIGLLAAFFHAINGLIIELAGGRVSSDHVETFFIFFVELAVFLSIITIIRKKDFLFPLFIGVVTGMAFLCKWTPALVVFPVWIAGELIANHKPKARIIWNLLIAVFSFAVVALPWLIYINHEFPGESDYVFKKFLFAYSDSLEQHHGPVYYYFNNCRMVFGELIWLPLFLSLYRVIRHRTDWKMVVLTLWWLIPFIVFSFAETKRHTYLLLSAPAVFLVLAYYLFFIWKEYKGKQWIKMVVCLALIVFPLGYCIERVKPFTSWDRNPVWATELKQMNGKYDKKTVFMNEEHAVEGMFYTDYIFYTGTPDEETLELLKEQGYRVIIRPN